MSLSVLGRNAFIYALGNIGLRAAAFLLVPLYTHLLLQADYGLLVNLLKIQSINLILINLGMADTIMRFARQSETEKKLPELIGSGLLIITVSGVLITLFMIYGFQPMLRHYLHQEDLFLLMALTCAGGWMQCLCNFFMGLDRA